MQASQPEAGANRLKTVLHVHTNYSHDSNTSPAELIETALADGIDCIGVTDHDEIDGAFEAYEAARGTGVRVIVGEEITSTAGHIIGLFLEERIAPGLSARETIRQIRAQGGAVLAPHPFATMCDASLVDAIHELRDEFDAVEICNSQNPLVWQDWRAARYVREHGLTPYVGADAHIRGYLAGSYQMLPAFHDARSFVAALRQAELCPGRFGLDYHVPMGAQHVFAKLFARRLPGFGDNLPGAKHKPVARRLAALFLEE